MKTLKGLAILVVLLLAGEFGGASGQTVTTLFSFSGNNGSSPSALIHGSDGNFYGTTSAGGTNSCGTVFRISPSGNLTSLYDFCSQPDDGYRPKTALVQGSDRNFYGTTSAAGAGGWGTVFRISSNDNMETLYSFTTNSGGIGNYGPYSVLVQGSDGNFYGGALGSGTNNFGQLFRVNPSGNLSTIYSFDIYDGAYPFEALVPVSSGGFYGLTYGGGNTNLNGGWGYGTVFSVTPSGTLTTLYSFSGGSEGFDPSAIMQGSDGNFYGTTFDGGNAGCGTVFRISPNGELTNLYSFAGGSNGCQPNAIVEGSDGNFYGTTLGKRPGNRSTLFRISPSGNFSNLYTFTLLLNGFEVEPNGLVQSSSGDFYGTTYHGGTNGNCLGGCGTVFMFSIPLSPPPYPINHITAVNLYGPDIVFSIPSVAGETYQLQFTTDLISGNWANVNGAVVSNSVGAMLTLTNFGGASAQQGFYRFTITP